LKVSDQSARLILVPEADGWCGQVPVLGAAT
jgi:hypothetical protein